MVYLEDFGLVFCYSNNILKQIFL